MMISINPPKDIELRGYNAHFYNPLLQKSSLDEKKLIKEVSLLFDVPVYDIHFLQYFDSETRKFSVGKRVLKLTKKGDTLKVRYCESPSDAECLVDRAKFAFSLGVPICEPLGFNRNFAVFRYIQGENILPENRGLFLSECAKIHSDFNRYTYPHTIDEKVEHYLHEMIDISLEHLLRTGIDKKEMEKLRFVLSRFPKIQSTFEHQDYGVHNLILDNEGKIRVVDEEAFGFLPFGYSLVRPVFGRENYRIVANYGDLESYLSFFQDKQREYIRNHLNYFRALFILRNSVRRHLAGNKEGTQKLLNQLEELEP